jgi:DNA-binding beta-propeller fold protein YncE
MDTTGWTTIGSYGEGDYEFMYPFDVAYDPTTDYVYIADTTNHRIVKTKLDGSEWYTFGTWGYGVYEFSYPRGVCYDVNSGYLYVADTDNNRIVKTKFDGTGWMTIGDNSDTYQFFYPTGIAYDSATDYIYVVDKLNRRIVRTRIDGMGWLTYGEPGEGEGQFDAPCGIALGTGSLATSAYLVSKNLLSNTYVMSIDNFTYTVEALPPGTTMHVQFSQTCTEWYNAVGELDGWTEMTVGTNTIDLSALDWSGNEFYYKIHFSTTNTETPVLADVAVTFTGYHASGTLISIPYDAGTIMDWKNIWWYSIEPEGTALTVWTRTGTTPTPDDTTWSPWVIETNNTEINSPSSQYIQYKVQLETTNRIVTPIFDMITIEYLPLEYSTPPNPPILQYPLDDVWINASQPSFEWVFSDPDVDDCQTGYQLQLDDTSEFDTPALDTGEVNSYLTTYTPPEPLYDGIWYWRVKVRDSFFTWSNWSTPYKLKIDSAPVIAYTPIDPGQYNNTGTIRWTWQPSQNILSGITGYYVCIGTYPGGYDVIKDDWTSTNVYELSGLAEGIEYFCKIKARNGAGTISEYSMSSDGILVDLTPPCINNASVDIELGANYTTSRTFSFQWHGFYDNLSGIAGYYYSLANYEYTSIGNWTDGVNGYLTVLVDGKTYVYVWAVDRAGNIGQAVADDIFVDTTPVVFTEPEPGEHEYSTTPFINCSITISDLDGSGVDASTIFYRWSTTGLSGYSSWLSPAGSTAIHGVHETIRVTTEPLPFAEGGTNYIQWRAKDAAGNGYTESADYQIKVLIQDPSVNHEPWVDLLFPETESTLTVTIVELKWFGTDPDGDLPLYYEIYLSTDKNSVLNYDDSALIARNVVNLSYRVIGLEDGETYYWWVRVNDGELYGYCSSRMPWSFHVDLSAENQVPTTCLLEPVNGTVIPSLGVTLAWEGNDNDLDPITYSVYLASDKTVVVGRVTHALLVSDYENLTYYVAGLNSGETYYWCVIPHDGKTYGHCVSGVWQFQVDVNATVEDNIAPIVTIIAPKNGTIYYERTVKVIWTGCDNFGGVGLYKYKISLDQGPYVDLGRSTEFTFINLPEGEHIVTVCAIDYAGNKRTVSVTFIVALVPSPAVALSCNIIAPKDGTVVSGNVIILCTASSKYASILSVEIKIDGSPWCNATLSNTTWVYRWDTTQVADGEHTIKARAYDGINYSAIHEITVIVSNRPSGKMDKEEKEMPMAVIMELLKTNIVYIILIVIVVIIIIIVALLIRRQLRERKRARELQAKLAQIKMQKGMPPEGTGKQSIGTRARVGNRNKIELSGGRSTIEHEDYDKKLLSEDNIEWSNSNDEE